MIPICLGATYTDCITGFKGVATGYVRYITGCNQVLLAPKIGEDGCVKESCWFDEQRLNRVGTDAIVVDNSRAQGFDKPAPAR